MKKVVVIGGGFAGSTVARLLEKKFKVILVDTKDYFEFTPGVVRSVVEPEHMKKIQVQHISYLKRGEFILGKVNRVEDRRILVNSKEVSFDYLVIASGSRYNSPFKDPNLVIAARAEELKNFYDRLCAAKRVLIIGGGLVGVEIAGEIASKYAGKEIFVVHANKRLMERTNERASEYARQFLAKRGVKIYFNEKIIKFNKGNYLSNKNRKFAAEIVFFCTGIVPNSDFLEKNFFDERRFIKVNSYLQLKDKKNIFAAGDANNCAVEKTAQNAEKQARVVAKNICALEDGGKLEAYENSTTPLVVSLGKNDGLFIYKNFNLYGIIPGLLKRVIEKKEMWKKL